MQQQVGRSAKSRMQHHGVADGSISQHGGDAGMKLMHAAQRPRRTPRRIKPDGMTRGRERGVRQREAERLADYLRGGGGAEELASAAGAGAGTTAHVGSVL